MGSFLLVGYYREREHPVRNALLVYSVYRLCDMGILLSAYLQHHHYGSSNFMELSRSSAPDFWLLPIALLILLSAAGKSGQFPFSFWVSRAMEGPTPSSAIFYGALSIHAGVFLLLRTSPLWFDSVTARVCIGLVGAASAVLATWIGHVQCNIKGQIGYASVAQVGLMFVELALGLETLVLIHFVGNACLRCYQLLVSPSAVAYLLRLQSSTFGQQRSRFSDWSWERVLIGTRLRSSLYVLASQEASMPTILNTYLFAIPQWTARHLLGENRTILGVWTRSFLLLLGLALGAGLSPRGEGLWLPFLVTLSLAYLLGAGAILSLPRAIRRSPLSQFYGLARSYPLQARLTFLSFLGMSGFPISPVFFGEDLLLSSILHIHPGLVVVFGLVFMLNGVVLARSFSRLFLGRPVYREQAQ
jgi:NADH:ubiquinone oxidoreductase subunit 5 (subunit L)/multisubunit Na+/H+ antiporter MnhA subunit